MSQVYGQIIGQDGTTNWKPIKATQLPDGSYALAVDTELVLDAANVSISNIKVGSTDQSTNNLRYIKTLDDGTVVVSTLPMGALESFNVARQTKGTFPRYFGLVNEDEDWIIIRQSRIGVEDIFEYASGSGSFTTNWGNRATTIVYQEYYVEF